MHPLTPEILKTINDSVTNAYLVGDIEYGEYIRVRFWLSDEAEKVGR